MPGFPAAVLPLLWMMELGGEECLLGVLLLGWLIILAVTVVTSTPMWCWGLFQALLPKRHRP